MASCVQGLSIFEDSPVIPVKTGIHHSAHWTPARQGASMTFAGVTNPPAADQQYLSADSQVGEPKGPAPVSVRVAALEQIPTWVLGGLCLEMVNDPVLDCLLYVEDGLNELALVGDKALLKR